MRNQFIALLLCVAFISPVTARSNSPEGSAMIGVAAGVNLAAMGIIGTVAKLSENLSDNKTKSVDTSLGEGPLLYFWSHELLFYPACVTVTLFGAYIAKLSLKQLETRS